jgi:hypothetical protein
LNTYTSVVQKKVFESVQSGHWTGAWCLKTMNQYIEPMNWCKNQYGVSREHFVPVHKCLYRCKKILGNLHQYSLSCTNTRSSWESCTDICLPLYRFKT